jgi:WD40 repeat protein
LSTAETVAKPTNLAALAKQDLDKFYNSLIRQKSTIQLWDSKSGELLRTIPSNEFSFGCGKYSPDGQMLVVAETPDSIVLFDARTLQEKHRWSTRSRLISDLAISPNGEWLVTAGNHNLQLWETTTGRLLYTFNPSPLFSATKIEFSHDGTMLAAAELSDDAQRTLVAIYDVFRGNAGNDSPQPDAK